MPDLILHHYPNSPFSEKVRVALGIKQLAWKSVVIPNMMPKPELMPLTGGYRRTPVLQVGADIYCDTQLIMLEIERRNPKPPLLPVGQEGEARALAMWIDRSLFWPAVGVVMGTIGEQLPDAFKKDRAEFTGRAFDSEALKANQPVAREQLYAQLAIAEQMLRDGRPFLLGAVAGLADCALWNPIWFLQARMASGDTPPPLDRFPKLVDWSKRMKAFGSGKPAEMPAAEALAVAKAATPEPGKIDDRDPAGFKAGQKVTVTPDDSGKVPVTGTLVGLSSERISIIRSDEQVGDVAVHFPRAGFLIQAA